MAEPELKLTEPTDPHEADDADLRDWRREQLATTAISLVVHTVLILLLLLFTHALEPSSGLPLFARFGDSKAAVGEIQNAEPTLFEPLAMPIADVTRLEPLDRPPVLAPELPRITLGVAPSKPEAGRPAESLDLQGFGTSHFEGVAERVQGVSVKIGDPQFTMIWDTDADLDLHVIEPGGSEIFWEERRGKKGGELDVDDVDGQGPENIYWRVGDAPRGIYQWWVHYYGGFGGKVRKTKWQVRVKHDGQVEVFEGTLHKIDDKSPQKTLMRQ